MLLTRKIVKLWNELVYMGFTPLMPEKGIIDITIHNSADELNFCAAVMNYNVMLLKVDLKESERYYKVGDFTVRVWSPKN
jgi:hypothetical protein